MVATHQEKNPSKWVTLPTHVPVQIKDKELHHFRDLLRGMVLYSIIRRNITIHNLKLLHLHGLTYS